MPDDSDRPGATGAVGAEHGRSDSDGSDQQDAAGEDALRDAGRDPGTVLLTGCSSGIGRATALTFLEDDWTVFATARDAADIDDLADAGCETAVLDVTDPDAVERVIERVVAEDGRIDALVNNAGYGLFGPVEEVPTDAMAAQFDVNVYGPHRLIRAALPHMRRQGRGRIVNVSSGWGRVAVGGVGPYAASKHALEALSDSLRQEVEQYGIEVSVVEPGPVDTGFTDRAADELAALERTGAYPWFETAFEDVQAVGGGGPGAIAPTAVADAILQAATCAEPQARYTVGVPASLANLGRLLPDRVRDRVFSLARRVLVRRSG